MNRHSRSPLRPLRGTALLFFSLLWLTACALPQRPDPEFPGTYWLEKSVPAATREISDAPVSLQKDQPLDFDECVFLAMHQAPGLINGAVELELSRLRTEDAFWKQFPELNMHFGVTSNLTQRNDDEHDGYGETAFRVGFSVQSFNPVANHFSHEASQIMERIAVLTHQKAIATLSEQIGEILLKLDNLTEIRRAQGALPQLAANAIDYWRTAEPDQAYESIEYARALQKEKQAKALLDKTDAEIAAKRLELKLLLGIDPVQNLDLDCSLSTILTSRDTGAHQSPRAWQPAWETSIDNHIAMLSLELQNYNILLAWSRYLPDTGLDIFTANPNSGYAGNSGEDDIFASLRFSVPLFDWGNRARGVEQARLQKTKTLETARGLRMGFAYRWAQSEQAWQSLMATRTLAEDNLNLAKLEARKAQIQFESGQASFASVLESREKVTREEIRLAESSYDLRRQSLRRHFMSGDFSKRYFGPSIHTPPTASDK